MNKIVEKKAIFPEFNIIGNEVYTQIRNIGYDGKWYVSAYRTQFSSAVGLEELKKCFVQAHRMWMFGIPSIHIIDHETNAQIFRLDEDQSSEEDRLAKTILC